MDNEPLLSEFADDEDMHELIGEFAVSLQETCKKLQRAIEEANLEVVRRIGHQLKGAGGGYGFPLITECGAKLESAVAKEGSLSEFVRQSATELITVCQRVQATP